ncbi:hypothetical protein [Clostridium botulinum]|uniref:hypothetical protein n=1 Tax=Clostridium botulinum TaxID=1491 RepID=UPI003DA5705E
MDGSNPAKARILAGLVNFSISPTSASVIISDISQKLKYSYTDANEGSKIKIIYSFAMLRMNFPSKIILKPRVV